MIAVDTNVLVYAHREDSEHHRTAVSALEDLVGAGRRWAVPWPCLHEFLAIVTHQRLYRPPTPVDQALGAVHDLFGIPGMTVLAEADRHLEVLGRLLASSGATGPKVHDARVAAICLGHGVEELWTADRDFSFFPALRTHNPLVG